MIFEKDRLEEGRKRYSLQNAKHWISTETGSHLLLDGDGNVVGGAGGALRGQKFVKVTRKSKDVEEKGKEAEPVDMKFSVSDLARESKAKPGETEEERRKRVSVLQRKYIDQLNKKGESETTEEKKIRLKEKETQYQTAWGIEEGFLRSDIEKLKKEISGNKKQNSSPIRVYRASR